MYRVLVVGDDSAQCLFLDQQQTWSAVLERRLGGATELVALSAREAYVGCVAGAGLRTQDLRRLLSRLLPQYPPVDAIVLSVGMSDVLDWLAQGAPAEVDGRARSLDEIFAEHPERPYRWQPGRSALADILMRGVRRLMPLRESARAGSWIADAAARRRSAARVTDALHAAALVAHVERQLTQAVRTAFSRARRVLVVLPRRVARSGAGSPEPDLFWYGALGGGAHGTPAAFLSLGALDAVVGRLREAMQESAEREGAECVDPSDEPSSDAALVYDGVQVTSAGAEVLGARVATQLLLPYANAVAPAPLAVDVLPARPTSQGARWWATGITLRSSLARGSVGALLVTGAGSAIGFAVQLLLARELGGADYGTYLLVLGWMNVATLFAKFDLDAVAIRFVAAYGATGALDVMHGFIAWSARVVWTLSIILAAVGALALTWLPIDLSPSVVSAARVACLLLPVTSGLLMQSGVLQGLRRVTSGMSTGQLLRPAIILLVLVILGLTTDGIDTPSDALWLNLGAALLSYLVGARILRIGAARALSIAPRLLRGEWAATALQVFPITLAQLILSQQSDVLVVGSMLGREDAAHYGAAAQLATLIAIPAGAVLAVSMPQTAELFVQEKRAELQALLDQTSRLSALLGGACAVAILAFSGSFLGMYGPAFASAQWPLVLLVLAQLIGATVGAQAGNLLITTGEQRLGSMVIGVSSAINLALSLPLTRAFGPVGTASATLAATAIRSLALSVLLRRRLGLRLLFRPW